MNDQPEKCFKVIEASFSPEVEPSLRESAEQHYLNCETLQRLIFDWVTCTRSVLVCNAESDPGEEEGFIVQLKDCKEDIAQIVISMEWLRKEYSHIEPATDWEIEEDGCRKVWSELVCDYLLGEEDNFKIMVSYLLTNYATIDFDSAEAWLFENCPVTDEDLIEGKKIVSVNPHYANYETGEGFGENRWALKEPFLSN